MSFRESRNRFGTSCLSTRGRACSEHLEVKNEGQVMDHRKELLQRVRMFSETGLLVVGGERAGTAAASRTGCSVIPAEKNFFLGRYQLEVVYSRRMGLMKNIPDKTFAETGLKISSKRS